MTCAAEENVHPSPSVVMILLVAMTMEIVWMVWSVLEQARGAHGVFFHDYFLIDHKDNGVT